TRALSRCSARSRSKGLDSGPPGESPTDPGPRTTQSRCLSAPSLSVPLQIPDLIKIHIPAAEHSHNLGSGGSFDQSMQQSRDGCSRGTLDHQFAMRHDPDHGSEDLAVRERDDVVHKTLHDRKRVIAHALHPEAGYDAVGLIERDDAAGCDSLLHR